MVDLFLFILIYYNNLITYVLQWDDNNRGYYIGRKNVKVNHISVVYLNVSVLIAIKIDQCNIIVWHYTNTIFIFL